MDIFANCYILIIFSVVYAAVTVSCSRVYKLTNQKIFRLLQVLFIMMLAEWLFTVSYELITYDLKLSLPRLDSAFKLYQIPKVLIKNIENALIAVCLNSFSSRSDADVKSCKNIFILIAVFTVFEIAAYFMPDTDLWLFIRGISDGICLIAVIAYFSFPWKKRSLIFRLYAVFSLIAMGIIVFENYADLYIPAVRDAIPEFYEAGDLYYFLMSLMIFYGLMHVRDNAAKQRIEADIEKKMKADLEQRIEEYKEESRTGQEDNAAAFDRAYINSFCAEHRLTKRESEIVSLAAGGRSNAEIAELLSISAATVRVHQHTAFQKIGISGRQELIDMLDAKRKSRADMV